jgi:hypothetical protein
VSEKNSGSQAGPSPTFLQTKKEVPIIAAYLTYRDADYLRSSLDSVCHYVDALAILDGRVLDQKELPGDATDKIISETASRFDPRFVSNGQKFAVFRTKPVLPFEKKNVIFAVVRSGCYAFLVHGDEICVGDVKSGLDYVREHALESEIFFVKVIDPLESTGSRFEPRIIKVKNGLHFSDHSPFTTVFDSDNEVFAHDKMARKRSTEISDFQIYKFSKERSE